MKFIVTVFAFFIVLPFSGIAQDNLLSHQLGAYKSSKKTAHGLQIITAGKEEVQLEVYSPTIVRVRIAPQDLGESESYAVIREAYQALLIKLKKIKTTSL